MEPENQEEAELICFQTGSLQVSEGDDIVIYSFSSATFVPRKVDGRDLSSLF